MITIVTGQPRTGTSMVMRILDMGGIPAEHNPAINIGLNPYGSYETNKLVNFQIPDGKSVKCLMPNNIFNVPHGQYKVIMPIRDSEQVILSRFEKFKGKIFPTNLEAQKKQVENQYDFIRFIVNNRTDMELLEIPYDDFFNNTDKVIEDINTFVGVPFDMESAKNAIDKTLYKIRTKEEVIANITK